MDSTIKNSLGKWMSEQSELPDSILSNPSINLVLERPSVSDRDSLSRTLFEVRMWVRNFFVWLQFCVPKIVETIHRAKNDYRPVSHTQSHGNPKGDGIL